MTAAMNDASYSFGKSSTAEGQYRDAVILGMRAECCDDGTEHAWATAWGKQELDTRAAELYTQAAEQGHADSQACLGQAYTMGRGVPRDLEKALWWNEQAAKQGHVVAATSLGLHFLDARARYSHVCV